MLLSTFLKEGVIFALDLLVIVGNFIIIINDDKLINFGRENFLVTRRKIFAYYWLHVVTHSWSLTRRIFCPKELLLSPRRRQEHPIYDDDRFTSKVWVLTVDNYDV